MTRRRAGWLLIVLGFVLIAAGIWAKRAFGRVELLIALHTLATLGGLLPGLMLLTGGREKPPGGGSPPGASPAPGSAGR